MSSPALPGIFGAMAPVLNHYGYFAVGFLVTIEDFGIPVPGETVLIAASLYAGAGRMNVVAVGVVAVLAAIIGDNIGFLIGHYGGRALALRFGRYVFLTAERLDKAEAFFQRHGGKIIVVARFIEGLRQANGIVAGISGMRWRRFLLFNAIGATLWVGVWVSLGYLAGNNIVTIYDQLTRYSLYVLIGLAVAVAALIGWHLRRRTRHRAQRSTEASAEAPAESTAEPKPAGSRAPENGRAGERSDSSDGAGEPLDGAHERPDSAHERPDSAHERPDSTRERSASTRERSDGAGDAERMADIGRQGKDRPQGGADPPGTS